MDMTELELVRGHIQALQSVAGTADYKTLYDTYRILDGLLPKLTYDSLIEISKIKDFVYKETQYEDTEPYSTSQHQYKIKGYVDKVFDLSDLRKAALGYASAAGQGEVAFLNEHAVEKFFRKNLPAANRTDRERFSELVNELRSIGVVTLAGLRDLCSKHLKTVLDEDARIVRQLEKGDGQGYASDKQRTAKGVFYSQTGLVIARVNAGVVQERLYD